uniref:Uncharacterized protein n=1 Tax=Malurus cyaneus samueli TaxID=2593467 RepID=A0A8C5UFQ2_9PASS
EKRLNSNLNFTYHSADWINHRDESLITISDSSDEELPLLLEMPEKQQTEEDDDDVVILAEVIFGSCNCCAFFIHGLYSQVILELTGNQEPGPSLLSPVKMSPQAAANTETICLGNADLPPQQEEKMEAREQQGENLEPEKKIEEIAAKTTMEQEGIQENNQLQPQRFAPVQDEPRAVANGCVPQQGQPEADPSSLRAYGEKAPGPAFPRPEPQQDGIPGPASPQPAHPPEEESGQPAGRDNAREQPGPAFPAQGSHELGSGDVPEQGAAGQEQEQDLTALLIRETVGIARAPLPPVCMMFSDRFFKVCRVSHAQNTQLQIFVWLRFSCVPGEERVMNCHGKLWFEVK